MIPDDIDRLDDALARRFPKRPKDDDPAWSQVVRQLVYLEGYLARRHPEIVDEIIAHIDREAEQ
jgi:hypothetical protein